MLVLLQTFRALVLEIVSKVPAVHLFASRVSSMKPFCMQNVQDR